MLYIFDQQKGALAGLGVLFDCVLSLLRQWTLRPNTGIDASVIASPTADHIPCFETIDPFRPRTSAIINGPVISVLLLAMTVIAIRYSWIHVLNLHIREIGTNWDEPVRAQPATNRPAWLQLDPYAGEYISKSPPARISIQIEGDPLEGQHLSFSLAATGHPSLSLQPLSPEKFVVVGAKNSYVVFKTDTQGTICCLSFVANGTAINAQRK